MITVKVHYVGNGKWIAVSSIFGQILQMKKKPTLVQVKQALSEVIPSHPTVNNLKGQVKLEIHDFRRFGF
jgi:hypothetical protein